MKHRRKVYFIEFAALLVQRTMEEGHPDLVLKWGQSMFEFLSRCALTIHLFADLKKEMVKINTFIVKTSNNALLSSHLRMVHTALYYR